MNMGQNIATVGALPTPAAPRARWGRPRVILVAALSVAALAGLIAAGVWSRPDLVPPWARIGRPAAEATPPAPAPTPEPGILRPIHLEGTGTAAEIGLESAEVTRSRVAPTVKGPGSVTYPAHDFAEIRPRVAGRIRSIPADVDEGRTVRKGQVLVVVDSPDVGNARANYLSLLPIVAQARANFDRSERLYKEKSTSDQARLADLAASRRLEAELLGATQRLTSLGFSTHDLAALADSKDTSGALEVKASMDGTLVERHAVVGEAVEPHTSLFQLVDLREMWCWVDMSEADAATIRLGQPGTFVIANTNGPAFPGHVELIGYAVNPATRSVRVRLGLENPEGRLRSNQYGTASVEVGPGREALLVPRAAVQEVGRGMLAFVPRADGKTFDPRRLTLREVGRADAVEVVEGLKAGERVVTTGSFLLKSDLLKDQISGE